PAAGERARVRGKSRTAAGTKRWTQFHRLCVTTLFSVLLADTAFAQRELRLHTVPETPLPFVTTVVAPAARHVAVNDTAGVIVVGHRPKSPTHLSIYQLDPQGQIIPGDPVPITLPKPAVFGD